MSAADQASRASAPRALSMLPNSLALIAAKVATLGLGFLFWLLAARLFSPREVGLAGGIVSAVLLCTQFALLGAGAAVITLFPEHADSPRRLLHTGINLVIVSAGIFGLAFVALATGAFPKLSVLGSSPGYALLFASMSIFGTLGIMLDQISTTLRRGDEALNRGLLNGVVSLVCLGGLAGITGGGGPMAIFACWVVGGAAACALGARQLWRGVVRYRWRPLLDRVLARRLMVVGLPNHILTLADRAPGLLLPILVTQLLSPTANAFWYAVWMMAWVLFAIPIQVGMTLFAEVTHRPAAIDTLVRHGLRVGLGLGVSAAIAMAALASVPLSLMGPRYASGGTDALRVLVWGVAPVAVIQVYYARCRAAHRLREAIAMAAVSGLATVAGAADAGATWGLTAMAAAWVCVQSAAAVWALWRLRVLAGGDHVRAPTGSPPRLWLRARVHATAARAAKVTHLTATATKVLAPRATWQPGLARAAGPPLRRYAPALTAVSLSLFGWFVALGQIDLYRMSAIGLLSVLPTPSLAAIGLLCLSFALELRRPRPRGAILLVHVVALLVMVYGLPAFVEPEPRFSAAWRHAGIIQTILHTRGVDPTIDAYFNWPGFFAAAALFQRTAGLHVLIPFLSWAPLAVELLSLAPLLVIMRALSMQSWLRWCAVWCFYLANWVGQDYFSPQAFAYLLYLILIGLVLVWFRGSTPIRPPWARRYAVADPEHPSPVLSPAARTALVFAVILMIAVVVASHQLTPFAVLIDMTALVALRRCSARGLPLVTAALVAAWSSYLAIGYLSGHLATLLGYVGAIGATVNQSVAGRVQGADGHVVVTTAQVGIAGGLWAMALFGMWRRARQGHDDTSAIALWGGSVLLPVLQPYGGEIVLRMFLFSLPFTAFFVAAMVTPLWSRRRSPAVAAGLAALWMVLAAGQLLVRYGNEQMDWFSRGDVAAVRALYRDASPQSTLVAWSTSLPWKYRDYAEHRYRVITSSGPWSQPAALAPGSPAQLAALASLMRGERHGAYLILTRSQSAQVNLLGLSRRGSVERLWRALTVSPAFRVVYHNPDGIVVTAVPGRKDR
jgi:O-antigen/teichoic acid export membrane protein